MITVELIEINTGVTKHFSELRPSFLIHPTPSTKLSVLTGDLNKFSIVIRVLRV